MGADRGEASGRRRRQRLKAKAVAEHGGLLDSMPSIGIQKLMQVKQNVNQA